jgi:hypothetical protein
MAMAATARPQFIIIDGQCYHWRGGDQYECYSSGVGKALEVKFLLQILADANLRKTHGVQFSPEYVPGDQLDVPVETGVVDTFLGASDDGGGAGSAEIGTL